MELTTKKVHFISLGCARNMVDSEMMAGQLVEHNYELSTEAKDSQLIIVNTCGFIDTAKQESIDTILEAAEYKNSDKGICNQLVVTGCLSERYPKELKDSIPEIDVLLGTTGFAQIIEALKKTDKNLITDNSKRLKDYDLPRINSQKSHLAYLKLAEGCAKRCSFCVIPSIRGSLRSRSQASLIKEVLSLTQSGVKELNLIAQDLTDYGRDRKDGSSLISLLNQLVKIKDLEWIRLFYAYPDQLSDEVIEFINDNEKVCSYLDLPLQHINSNILKTMNRKITREEIENMIFKLKEKVPNISIRTSLMVGYPTETETEFNQLCDFVNQGLLDHVGIFTYSHEKGSHSAKIYNDEVDAEEKTRRKDLLNNTFIESEIIKREKLIGKTFKTLIDGPHPESEHLLVGRNYFQGPDVDSITIINEGTALPGEFVNCEITELAGIDLIAKII